ncbi:dnaJ homolog subfamily C member 1-like [Ornithodoros turicata]|uniref:dnaJ homolog subfamily C member 1-like n=1 Tax=Ornithodoros turicata TaxID=34597 RepID=UPI0031397926
MFSVSLIASLLLYGSVGAWTQDDFEVFDAVEDVNENFYSFLGLPEDAGAVDIKKAYRRLSLLYHPDKNKDAGAEEKFRKLVSVAEILKNEDKRKIYDNVLKNGLPGWRQPVFYYRRVRKMGGKETAIFLVALFTFGQYIISWAAYWERKYEVEETVFAKFKHRDRKSKKTTAVNEEELRAAYINTIQKPTWRDLLVIKFCIFIILYLKGLPIQIATCVHNFKERKEANVDEASSDDDSSTEDSQIRERKPRRRTRSIPDAPEMEPCVTFPHNGHIEDHPSAPNVSHADKKGEWTEEDTVGLIRAMKKYPTGTVDRWLKIADLLNRSQDEVIAIAKRLRKAPSARNIVPHAQGVTGDDYEDRQSDEEMTRSEHYARPSSKPISELKLGGGLQKKEEWSVAQQKCLESALQQYPKGTEERWDKIASAVPGKTKEECMLRFKYLVEVLRKKRAEEKGNAA